MKKVISILVALCTAVSISAATFAADDNPGVNYSDQVMVVDHADDANTAGMSSRINVIGISGDIQIGVNELFLVDATSKVVGGVYNKLDPDTEYKFRIYYNNTGTILNSSSTDTHTLIDNGVELNGALISKGTIRLRTMKGSTNIQSARINTIGRGDSARYEMVIKTRANYGTKLNDVDYSLNVTGSALPAGTFAESTHSFEVGYDKISDEDTDVGEDGVITISNDYPVITKDQFTDISKSANYKNVRFESEEGDWIYTGRTSGMPDSNFYYSYDVVPELVTKFPEQDFKFLTFKAGVTFPTNGEMRIDVSDIYDNFSGMYTYLYRNGKLTRVDTTHDTGANEVVFRTNYLGAFVITDVEITDTTIINDINNEPEPAEELEPPTTDMNHNNPGTGADRTMSVAVTLGLVSLVSAGAISRKKKA